MRYLLLLKTPTLLVQIASNPYLMIRTQSLVQQQAEQKEYELTLDKLKAEFQERWSGKQRRASLTITDFQRFQTLGTGSFGRVVLVRQKSTGSYYAMKILDKLKVVRTKQVEHTLYEKRILMSIRYPLVVYMEQCFKDNSYLYLLLPFINGGEMFTHLKRRRKFEEGLSKFYAAQVVLCLEYLHHLDLVYRDLKPENILIDSNGYLKLTDFGFCKLVRGRTYTLCGTPDYIAPEILANKGYGYSVDWWSFGILIYEMSAGYPPFYSHNHLEIYEKITSCRYKFAPHFSDDLKDLIHHMLQVDVTRRYGILKGGAYDIKAHKWFKSINWMSIYNKTTQPPFKPQCRGSGDTSNFEYYSEEPLDVASKDMCAKEFADF